MRLPLERETVVHQKGAGEEGAVQIQIQPIFGAELGEGEEVVGVAVVVVVVVVAYWLVIPEKKQASSVFCPLM